MNFSAMADTSPVTNPLPYRDTKSVGAADFVETNHAALRPLFDSAAWPEFEKLVRGYAFADAQAQLDHALKTFAGSLT